MILRLSKRDLTQNQFYIKGRNCTELGYQPLFVMLMSAINKNLSTSKSVNCYSAVQGNTLEIAAAPVHYCIPLPAISQVLMSPSDQLGSSENVCIHNSY